MPVSSWVVLFYGAVYVCSFALAYIKRGTFPFSESAAVVGIIGIGFTGLVFLATLFIGSTPITIHPSASELFFTIGYLVLTAAVLLRRSATRRQPGQFWQEKFTTLTFKLSLFVLIPLASLKIIWQIRWSDLGFTPGDLPGQLLAALVLMILFGGFNLAAGSAAGPIRRRQFSRKQVLQGLATAFCWNILETGLVEEFFFRAFVQTMLINALGSALAGICLVSLLFGLAHAPGIYLRKGDERGPLGESPTLINSILYSVVVLSTTGWFSGLLYWRTQSLVAPILVHAAIDAVAHTVEFIEGAAVSK